MISLNAFLLGDGPPTLDRYMCKKGKNIDTADSNTSKLDYLKVNRAALGTHAESAPSPHKLPDGFHKSDIVKVVNYVMSCSGDPTSDGITLKTFLVSFRKYSYMLKYSNNNEDSRRVVASLDSLILISALTHLTWFDSLDSGDGKVKISVFVDALKDLSKKFLPSGQRWTERNIEQIVIFFKPDHSTASYLILRDFVLAFESLQQLSESDKMSHKTGELLGYLLKQMNKGKIRVVDLFEKIDQDHSGTITAAELQREITLMMQKARVATDNAEREKRGLENKRGLPEHDHTHAVMASTYPTSHHFHPTHSHSYGSVDISTHMHSHVHAHSPHSPHPHRHTSLPASPSRPGTSEGRGTHRSGYSYHSRPRTSDSTNAMTSNGRRTFLSSSFSSAVSTEESMKECREYIDSCDPFDVNHHSYQKKFATMNNKYEKDFGYLDRCLTNSKDLLSKL